MLRNILLTLQLLEINCIPNPNPLSQGLNTAAFPILPVPCYTQKGAPPFQPTCKLLKIPSLFSTSSVLPKYQICLHFWKPRRADNERSFQEPSKKERSSHAESIASERLQEQQLHAASKNRRKQITVAGVETVSWERMWLEWEEIQEKNMGRKCWRAREALRACKWAGE